jgi:phosphatidylserine/phosphatidylglycerophosphate/cardiolipin synthase-like enzyme
VIDSIAGSQRTISLASDQLRPSGFDLTVRNLILQKYSPPHAHHSTFETRVYWGRQRSSSPHDEEVKQGQKLLDALRQRCKIEIKKNSLSKSKSRQVRFLPLRTSGPMSNHAKFLVQDGFRCLITSLNLFGGKSEEFDIMDATELGIVIDCDRLSHVVEGEMDLMMGSGYVDPSPLKFDPIIRLFMTVFHTALLDRQEECSLDELMEEFFRRVLDMEHNATLWHRYMNRTGVQDSLQQALKILKDMEPTIVAINQFTHEPVDLKDLHKNYKNGMEIPDPKSITIKYIKGTLNDVGEQFEHNI